MKDNLAAGIVKDNEDEEEAEHAFEEDMTRCAAEIEEANA